METFSIQNLLFKFSYSTVILPYFKNIESSEAMMKSLCTTTRELWQTNKNAYSNLFGHARKQMIYHKEFDDEFAQYLLEDDKFQFYTLEVMVKSIESYESLIKFINKTVDNKPYPLKLSKISFLISEADSETYSLLHECLINARISEDVL